MDEEDALLQGGREGGRASQAARWRDPILPQEDASTSETERPEGLLLLYALLHPTDVPQGSYVSPCLLLESQRCSLGRASSLTCFFASVLLL